MRHIALHSLLLIVAAVAADQDSATRDTAGVGAPTTEVQAQTAVTGSNSNEAPGTTRTEKHVVRASQLIGHNVQNASGDTVGEINDVVLDPSDGQIRYIAFSAGGFLGLGEKYFAVPWESFQWRQDQKQEKIILNVEKSAFQNAKGFDKDNWPNMADEKWQLENNRAFAPRSASKNHAQRRPAQ